MIIKKELLKREIAGETILIPVNKTVYDSHGLFALNEMAGFLWDGLPEAVNEVAVVAAVLQEYDAAESDVRRDVTEFLNKLKEMDIL